ncbi:TatD family hydrolase [Glaciecola sp. MH2013]|uniref:TatD family hydrolase n=1 Tax=Glaciecola sp. MH2013 TaxID=2785524 RepID=UPI0018A00CD6|nr:TatD family hydrolase [Glaciecola sp. MH2013]MBF7072906.1 TatD family hydrolase [Glaciecola sp. MH2013]
MFVDSHCHLDRLKKTDNELLQVVGKAQDRKVEHMLCVAVSVKEFESMRKAVAGFDNVSLSCGVHPLHNEDVTDYDTLLEHAKRDDVVAVGETGLDYFYSAETKDIQKNSFIDHIKVANEVNKPLIIHTRDAREDTISLLKQYKNETTNGVLHCFTESLEMAKEAISLGFYISISGIVTFASAKELQETVKLLPLERLLIETDSPWLAPVPHRGKENEPANVVDVAYFISELKGISVSELAKATTDNFYKLFSQVKRV